MSEIFYSKYSSNNNNNNCYLNRLNTNEPKNRDTVKNILINDDHLCEDIIICRYSYEQKDFFKYRTKLLGWLFSINCKLGAQQETFFKAVKYYDMYLQKAKEELDVQKLQLIISICYFIAYKIEELNIIDIKFLKESVLKNKYTEQEIIRAEIDVLKKLSFKIQIQTLNSKSLLLLELLKTNIDSIDINNKLSRIINFCNLTSLIVVEFMFNLSLSQLITINAKIALKLLYENNIISKNIYNKSCMLLPVNGQDRTTEELEEVFYNVIENKYDDTLGDEELYKKIFFA
jgi:hypothetical protein